MNSSVVVPDGHIQCSVCVKSRNWRCPNTFPIEYRRHAGKEVIILRCPHHRKQAKDWESKQPKKETDALAVPVGYTQCSVKTKHWRCCNTFPTEFRMVRNQPVEVKQCPQHRASARSSAKSGFKQETDADYRERNKDHIIQQSLEYRQTQEYREVKRSYDASEAGKIARKRSADKMNAKPINKLRKRISQMCKNVHIESVRVSSCTEFQSNAAFRKHMEDQFADWMTWENYGQHLAGMPYKTKWNIGHKIACALYDTSNPVDVRRCNSAANMFPQDSKENRELGIVLPPTEVLLTLQPYWPLGWNDELPPQVVVDQAIDEGFESGASSNED